MEVRNLNPNPVRAAIFDVYGTLLEVGPPPPDAEAAWHRLCAQLLPEESPPSRLEFAVATSKVIARHHAAAQAQGIRFPEVRWASVVGEVLPKLLQLSRHDQAEFLFRQIQTGHTTRMTLATATMLRSLKERGCLLGIASNAQAYTLRELQEVLGLHGLGWDLFEPDLRFWSFEQGFSKPDPHVFHLLTTRLAERGIPPQQTVMVGDRLDNDIVPAQAFGWQTWHVAAPGLQTWDGLLHLTRQGSANPDCRSPLAGKEKAVSA